MNRREFTNEILSTVTSFALIDTLLAINAIGKNIKPIKPITDHWAIKLNEYCSDLKTALLKEKMYCL